MSLSFHEHTLKFLLYFVRFLVPYYFCYCLSIDHVWFLSYFVSFSPTPPNHPKPVWDLPLPLPLPQTQLCLPLHILEERGLPQVAGTVSALLELAPPKHSQSTSTTSAASAVM